MRTKVISITLLADILLILVPVIATEAFSGAGAGTETDPYIITNVYQLQEMKENLTAWYALGNDIDASETRYWNEDPQNPGTYFGFVPIGDYDNKFSGNFDGKGFTITRLMKKFKSYTGLFGCIDEGGEIINVGLLDVDIANGYRIIGGLAGLNFGTIANCYSNGNVSGFYHVGGLVGYNVGTINNSYSTASVRGIIYHVWGSSNIGGLVGSGIGPTTNCLSTGSVRGSFNVGGLVGMYGNCTDCFWDMQTSGQTTSACGTGKATAEMKQKATFTNWDFDTVWDILEGQSYPFLRGVGGEEPPEEPPIQEMIKPVDGEIKVLPNGIWRGYYYKLLIPQGDPILSTLVYETGFHEKNGEVVFNESRKYKGKQLEPGRVYEVYHVYHEGIDIDGLEGEALGREVKAAASGKVIWVGDNPSGKAGKWVWIEHENIAKLNGTVVPEISTRYLHLDNIAPGITKDSTIAQGTKIGEIGRTGTYYEHLHFEVRQGDTKDLNHRNTLSLNPCEFVDYQGCQSSGVAFIGECPIDLVITDPDGLTISKEMNQIPTLAEYIEAMYYGSDEDVSHQSHDSVIFYELKTGDYLVSVTPAPDSNPTDTYNLRFMSSDMMLDLAEFVQIPNIPDEPYLIRSTEDGIIPIIPATTDFDPDTLNLKSEGKWITVYIELPVGHGYDVSDINLARTFLEGLLDVQHSDIQDGVMMVKFDMQDLIIFLESVVGVIPPDDVPLTITGELKDGRRFEGSDIVRVIKEGGKN